MLVAQGRIQGVGPAATLSVPADVDTIVHEYGASEARTSATWSGWCAWA
ncbi:hypothetical protein [Massilia rhizosphaerae]|nr:hypothetical protein [Massilia rhizosphaerae]